jgi:hypothetical protein
MLVRLSAPSGPRRTTVDHVTLSPADPEGPVLHFVPSQEDQGTSVLHFSHSPEDLARSIRHVTLSPQGSERSTVRFIVSSRAFPAEYTRNSGDSSRAVSVVRPTRGIALHHELSGSSILRFDVSPEEPGRSIPNISRSPDELTRSISRLTLSSEESEATGTPRPTLCFTLSQEQSQDSVRQLCRSPETLTKFVRRLTLSLEEVDDVAEAVQAAITKVRDISPSMTVLESRSTKDPQLSWGLTGHLETMQND